MSGKRIAWWGVGAMVVLLVGFLLANGRRRAQSISCGSSMKSMCLAARMYAADNAEIFAPSFLAMSNELVSPKILHCPADRSRPCAFDWSDYSITNCSYEWLAAGAKNGPKVDVIVRCPIHGHLGYSDGAVSDGARR
jgi:hypothetical protein